MKEKPFFEAIQKSINSLLPIIESFSSLYFFILGENKNLSKIIEYRNMLSDIYNYNIWTFYITAIKKNI